MDIVRDVSLEKNKDSKTADGREKKGVGRVEVKEGRNGTNATDGRGGYRIVSGTSCDSEDCAMVYYTILSSSFDTS
jgi:hypothetical protein